MLKVLLLPGMDGTGKLYGPLIDQLATEFDLETVPYRTDRALSYHELEPIVQSTFPETEPFVLVAESFSSPLAVTRAARHPSNLKGLILCAGFVSSPVRGWRRFLCMHLPSVAFRRALPDFATRWFLAGSNAPPQLLAAILSAISSVDANVLVHRVRAILDCDARAELANVQVPILYLQATQDRLVGRSSLDEIRRVKVQVTVEQIVGPHLILQREPEQSAAAIKAWLSKITRCSICGRDLNVESDPLSGDCGGDCWGCISQVEAEGLGASIEEYRADPGRFLPRD